RDSAVSDGERYGGGSGLADAACWDDPGGSTVVATVEHAPASGLPGTVRRPPGSRRRKGRVEWNDVPGRWIAPVTAEEGSSVTRRRFRLRDMLLGAAAAGTVGRSLRTVLLSRRVLGLREPSQAPVVAPLVTVIVPARNEGAGLDACVRAIRA